MTMRLNRFNACSKMRHRLSIYRFSIFLLLRALSTTVKKKDMGLQGCSQKTIMTEAKSMVRFSSDEKKQQQQQKQEKQILRQKPRFARYWLRPRDPFLEGPEMFSHPKSRSKISNLMTSELFYAHILNINRGSLHTRSFRRIHLSVFKYRLIKNGIAGSKSFRGFRETGPCPRVVSLQNEW